MKIIKTLFTRIKNIILHGYYIPTQYYIYEDKKLAYIPIPKVACTSIKTAIMGNDLKKSNYNSYMNIHSLATNEHEQLSLNGYENFFKIAFVRSPFDRLVSCYEDKVINKKQHNGRHFFSSGYNNIFIKTIFRNNFRQNMSFDEFVLLVSKIPDCLADAHFKSQYAFLYKGKKKIPDYIGKFEKISSDWQPIADKYKFNALPLMNKTNRHSWIDYYKSKKTIELVATRYKLDIEFLGYADDYKMLINKIP